MKIKLNGNILPDVAKFAQSSAELKARCASQAERVRGKLSGSPDAATAASPATLPPAETTATGQRVKNVVASNSTLALALTRPVQIVIAAEID